MIKRALTIAAVWLSMSACGAERRSSTADGGATRDAATEDAAPALDSGDARDAASTIDSGGADGGTACTPMPGATLFMPGCTEVNVAVFARAGAPDEVQISGRIDAVSESPSCARIDSIELTSGERTVQRFELHGQTTTLGAPEYFTGAPAAAELSEPCSGDGERFYPYGVVFRGTVDGGRFEARCGPGTGHTSYPPDVIRTCHRGIDRAAQDGNAFISAFRGGAAEFYGSFSHPEGTRITAVDSDVRIIGITASFGAAPAPPPFDTTGWMGFVGETGAGVGGMTISSVSLVNPDDVYGTTLCPVSDTLGPGFVPSGAIIARITGTTSAGTFSSELYSRACTRPPPPPAP